MNEDALNQAKTLNGEPLIVLTAAEYRDLTEGTGDAAVAAIAVGRCGRGDRCG